MQENGFNSNSYASGDEINSFKWAVCVNTPTAGTEALVIVEGTVEVESTSAMILVTADPDAPLGVVGGEEPVEEVEERASSHPSGKLSRTSSSIFSARTDARQFRIIR